MTAKPTPMPEGELIRSALTRTGLSARKAAEKAGISEGRWRQIVNGYQVVTKGTYVPVRGPADTLAVMAQTVDIQPEQLAEAGRPDAAEELKKLREAMTVAPGRPPADERWDGELVGPSDVLREDERLYWRDEPRGRRYRLADADDDAIHAEYRFAPGETPEEVIEDLRDLLGPHRVAVEQMERRRARR